MRDAKCLLVGKPYEEVYYQEYRNSVEFIISISLPIV
jgi:hypothetical protein